MDHINIMRWWEHMQQNEVAQQNKEHDWCLQFLSPQNVHTFCVRCIFYTSARNTVCLLASSSFRRQVINKLEQILRKLWNFKLMCCFTPVNQEETLHPVWVTSFLVPENRRLHHLVSSSRTLRFTDSCTYLLKFMYS